MRRWCLVCCDAVVAAVAVATDVASADACDVDAGNVGSDATIVAIEDNPVANL